MRIRASLLALLITFSGLCACTTFQSGTSTNLLKIEDGGFIVVASGFFKPPTNVNSYDKNGKKVDLKRYDSFHHIYASKDSEFALIASSRNNKILSVTRDGKVKLLELSLSHPYDTFFDITKVANNIWAVSLNGVVYPNKKNLGRILYMDSMGNVWKQETTPHIIDGMYISFNNQDSRVLRYMEYPGKDMVFILGNNTNYREIIRFDVDYPPNFVVRDCVAFNHVYCFANVFDENQQWLYSEIGRLNSENAVLESSVKTEPLDNIVSSEHAALLTTSKSGYLCILTEDGKIHQSLPSNCKDCEFVDIDSIGKDVYVMFVREKQKRQNKCNIAKWDKTSNSLSDMIEFAGGCGKLIMVSK